MITSPLLTFYQESIAFKSIEQFAVAWVNMSISTLYAQWLYPSSIEVFEFVQV